MRWRIRRTYSDARCRKIQEGFWEPVNKAMDDLGFTHVENNETYWIGCQRTGGLDEAVSREEFDMIATHDVEEPNAYTRRQ